MKKILNYNSTKHFENQLNKRKITPFLASMCLSKGTKNIKESNKIEYNLSQEKILTAIEEGYILIDNCFGMIELTIVTINNALITVYARYGDTGI